MVPEGYLALHLLQANMDLRFKRQVLDSKTYLQILESDLNTLSEGQKLRTVASSYTGYLKHELEEG